MNGSFFGRQLGGRFGENLDNTPLLNEGKEPKPEFLYQLNNFVLSNDFILPVLLSRSTKEL
jgi:hypothetical protein